MDAQQAMAQFEATQQALQNLEMQLGRIEEQAIELRRALSTLDAVGDAPALVPIGGGVHVPARLADGPVISPIGAGYAAEMSVEEAKAMLEERIQEAESLFRSRSQDAERLAKQARQLAQQAQG